MKLQHIIHNNTLLINKITRLMHVSKENKRAHRALGRSPEEYVKGQGEAIYRGPLMLFTKYW